MAEMTDMQRAELLSWCRFAHVDDADEDGVCKFYLKFRIRDADMRKVWETMSYGDAVSVASDILSNVCRGCEEFWTDWSDPDNEAFGMDVEFDGESIVMEGSYRT